MPKSSQDIIDEKIKKDGWDSFRDVSLADFLAAQGLDYGKTDLAGIAIQLADADVFRYLPAISSALRDMADDTGEFAALVADMAGRTRGDLAQGPLIDALVDVGAAQPETAARLARRLIKLNCARHAACLVGGAMRDAPAECAAIAGALVRSNSDEEAAAGITAMRIAWKKDGIADVAAAIVSLAPSLSSPAGESATAETMDALVDLYPAAAGEAGPLIEGMARRHALCRSRLAWRIRLPSSPFDDAAALRYLSMCIEGEPDFQTMDSVYAALAGLSKTSPDAAIKAVARCVFGAKYASANAGYALQEIGRASPESLTLAILDKAGANFTPAVDMRMHSIVADIATHADPEAILGPLFDALDSGNKAAARPALCMIRAMVTRNHDTTHDAELASRTLRRLVRYAKARGIDAKPELKKERDTDLKCAAVIRRILLPPPDIDAGRVLENLEMFPSLKKAFGAKWFRNAATGGLAPHPLVAFLSSLSLDKIEALLAEPPPNTPAGAFNHQFRLRYESGPFEALSFLDWALKLLEGAGLGTKKYVENMKNRDQFRDTVAEIALVAPFVAGRRHVELEPCVGKKRLDAAIELGEQRVLFEVLSPRTWEPLEMLDGARGIPTGRVPGKIFDKAKNQLPPPCACADQIVVAVDTSYSEAVQNSIVDYVLGPTTYTVAFNQDTGEAIAGGGARDAGESMHHRDARTDSISAVVHFKPTMSSDMSDAVQGTIVENPHARVPLATETLKEIARVLQGVPAPGGARCGGGAQ